MWFYLRGLILTLGFLIPTIYHPSMVSARISNRMTALRAAVTPRITVIPRPTITPIAPRLPNSAPILVTRHAVDPHLVPTFTGTLSANWAGYVAAGSAGTFLRATTTFIIPTLTGKPNAKAAVSIWAGMGGATPNIVTSLIQAGIDSRLMPADARHPKPYQVNEAWFEAYPQNSLVITFAKPKSLSAGNTINVEVRSQPDDLHTQVQDKYIINDLTTGETQTGKLLLTDTSFQTDGASGECIVERPFDLISNNYMPLPQFGKIALSGCEVSKKATPHILSPIGDYSNSFKISMVDVNRKVIAGSGALTNNGQDCLVTQSIV